jgi:hypothetical protein
MYQNISKRQKGRPIFCLEGKLKHVFLYVCVCVHGARSLYACMGARVFVCMHGGACLCVRAWGHVSLPAVLR